MATFVLVHGAWHGGWCWRKVTPLLRQRGHHVETPTLTGLGDRGHLLTRSITLSTHIQDICRVMHYEDLTAVVLVGHSYAGMVVTGVAHKTPERISHLVYFDTLIPADGQCSFDLMPESRPVALKMAEEAGEGWYVPPPGPAVFGVTDPQDKSWMEPRLTPMPLAVHEEPLAVNNPLAQRIPASYILCSGYASPALRAKQRAVAHARASSWDYYEIDTTHDAMITAPRKLADILLNIAEKV